MIFRVTLKGMGADKERIRFDLSVDKDMRPLPDIAYFGFYGALADTELSGAVLLSAEGLIDLGWGFETRGRFHQTNILSKRIELGGYATVWWKWDAEPVETTFVIEAVTQLSAITGHVDIPKATSVHVETIEGLPRFRARVVKSFDIVGYDNKVYRPPIGTEGDLARIQDECFFCADEAVSESGELITARVDPANFELIM